MSSLPSKITKLFWQASTLGLKKSYRLSRFSLYERLASWGSQLSAPEATILSVSHSTRLAKVLGLDAGNIVEANYPKFDILNLPFEDESFGWVLSDQVLEHVAGNPLQAIDECHRVLKPGGIAVHTTCHIYPIHGEPNDFWRFTPHGLKLLHQDWSEIVDVGGWGNQRSLWAIRNSIHAVKIPTAKWHPLHRLATRNDRSLPIVTWIIARK